MKTIFIEPENEMKESELFDFLNRNNIKYRISEEESENENFYNFSENNLNRAYSDNEPDYSNVLIKEKNTEYRKRQ